MGLRGILGGLLFRLDDERDENGNGVLRVVPRWSWIPDPLVKIEVRDGKTFLSTPYRVEVLRK